MNAPAGTILPDHPAGTADALVATRADLIAAEARELMLVAHFADQHNHDTVSKSRNPGRERARAYGGIGTPEVAEFAVAELGCLLGIGSLSASNYLRDALDLRHRHPWLWAAATDPDATEPVRVWQARKVAALCHAANLDREQTRWVDRQTTRYAGSLPWGRFVDLVEAKIIAADPQAAEQRRLAAELDRFVSTGRSREHGLTTLIARATSGDVIFFVAMCDRIAAILAERGDTRPIGVRRSEAIGILANPAAALAMLTQAADQHTGEPEVDPATGEPEPGSDVETSQAAENPAGEDNEADGQNTAAIPGADLVPRFGPGQLTRFHHLTGTELDRARNHACLYVHVPIESLFSHEAAGVARVEDIGPILTAQVRDWLRHTQVTVKPVLDPSFEKPADGYEVPQRLREAVHLTSPAEAFPYSNTLSRRTDIDHTIPYVPLDEGGSPEQTNLNNLGKLTRYSHRVKTHGRGWWHQQIAPGVHLWRNRYGYHYRVDHTGTHPLGKHPPPQAMS